MIDADYTNDWVVQKYLKLVRTLGFGTYRILHNADMVQEGEAVQQEVEAMQKNLVEADQSRAGRRSPYKVHQIHYQRDNLTRVILLIKM